MSELLILVQYLEGEREIKVSSIRLFCCKIWICWLHHESGSRIFIAFRHFVRL